MITICERALEALKQISFAVCRIILYAFRRICLIYVQMMEMMKIALFARHLICDIDFS